jgi:hypothetical protein
MEIYKKISDSFSDEGLDDSSDEVADKNVEEVGAKSDEEGGEEGGDKSSEKRGDKSDGEEGGDKSDSEESRDESSEESRDESSEESGDEGSNDLDEIIERLKKQINSDKEQKAKKSQEAQEVQEENILIKFRNDRNLERIQNEYINKIKNLNKNVIVTFKIPEDLIRTRVFTFFKCWRNGYCLNSSNTMIPKNIIKVLFTKN